MIANFYSNKVLLVEDNPDEARMIERAFLNAEFNLWVIRVPSGDEAIAYLTQLLDEGDPSPSLIISDMQLPGMSAIDMIRHLRNCAFTRTIPIIAHSGNEDPVLRSRFFRAGGTTYSLKRTCECLEVVEHIRSWLRSTDTAKSHSLTA